MNRLRVIVTTAAMAITLAACVGESTGTTTPGPNQTTVPTTTTVVAGRLVSGYVHAGPTCPVAQNPPDPACEDRAVANALLLVLDSDGTTVSEIRTDQTGRFSVLLPAGTYRLVPRPVDGLLGTPESQEFTVGSAVPPDLDIAYDTGIR